MTRKEQEVRSGAVSQQNSSVASHDVNTDTRYRGGGVDKDMAYVHMYIRVQA